MKGDKGLLHHSTMNADTLGDTDLVAEFSGTLLGFDDFVSMW